MPPTGNRIGRLSLTLEIAAILLGCSLILPPGQADAGVGSGATGPPHRLFDRVFIIVLENANYGDALQQPFLRHLTTLGALFTDYHAITHPSYPNYIAMAAGTTFGIRNSHQKDLGAMNLVDLLERAGVTWKAYAENLPAPCFTGELSPDGLYVRRHEPYISFRNIRTNRSRCERIVNAAHLPVDLGQDALPQYSLYVPNLRNDGHGTPLVRAAGWVQRLLGRDPGLATADAWLQGFLSPRLQDPHFTRGTLLVVTFDENDGVRGNQIYTAFVGPMVRPGITNGTRYTHYRLLRTIEANYGLGTLGQEDATASPICCIWQEGSR